MSNWSIYLEAFGSPLYGHIEVDEDLTEDEVWDMVSDHVLMTLEVTKED